MDRHDSPLKMELSPSIGDKAAEEGNWELGPCSASGKKVLADIIQYYQEITTHSRLPLSIHPKDGNC